VLAYRSGHLQSEHVGGGRVHVCHDAVGREDDQSVAGRRQDGLGALLLTGQVRVVADGDDDASLLLSGVPRDAAAQHGVACGEREHALLRARSGLERASDLLLEVRDVEVGVGPLHDVRTLDGEHAGAGLVQDQRRAVGAHDQEPLGGGGHEGAQLEHVALLVSAPLGRAVRCLGAGHRHLPEWTLVQDGPRQP
jgi:hypothetical protein